MTDGARDMIHIRDLAVECIIGVNPEERDVKQKVVINLDLWCDLAAGAATDSIDDTVDYKKINKAVVTLVKASRYQLIETMADRIASCCLAVPGIDRVRVTVDKPGALRHARSVAVEIERGWLTR